MGSTLAVTYDKGTTINLIYKSKEVHTVVPMVLSETITLSHMFSRHMSPDLNTNILCFEVNDVDEISASDLRLDTDNFMLLLQCLHQRRNRSKVWIDSYVYAELFAFWTCNQHLNPVGETKILETLESLHDHIDFPFGRTYLEPHCRTSRMYVLVKQINDNGGNVGQVLMETYMRCAGHSTSGLNEILDKNNYTSLYMLNFLIFCELKPLLKFVLEKYNHLDFRSTKNILNIYIPKYNMKELMSRFNLIEICEL